MSFLCLELKQVVCIKTNSTMAHHCHFGLVCSSPVFTYTLCCPASTTPSNFKLSSGSFLGTPRLQLFRSLLALWLAWNMQIAVFLHFPQEQCSMSLCRLPAWVQDIENSSSCPTIGFIYLWNIVGLLGKHVLWSTSPAHSPNIPDQ